MVLADCFKPLTLTIYHLHLPYPLTLSTNPCIPYHYSTPVTHSSPGSRRLLQAAYPNHLSSPLPLSTNPLLLSLLYSLSVPLALEACSYLLTLVTNPINTLPTHLTHSSYHYPHRCYFSSPGSRRLLQAAMVLATTTKTGLIPESGEPTYNIYHHSPKTGAGAGAGAGGNDHHDGSTSGGSMISSPSSLFSPWSYQDRISVLGGLCEVLKTSQQASEHITKSHNECQKLLTITSKQRFREADFMKVCVCECV